MTRSALLVIDMQNDLCHDPRRREKVEAMLPDLRATIELFASAGRPVLYTRFELPPGDPQFARFGDRYCIEGTEGAEIIAELLPLRGPAIRKTKHSAFYGTELDDRLRADGVDALYLAGLQTHICVMTTAADASFRGYRPVAVRECVVSSRDAASESALEWIARYVGEVHSLEQVHAEIGRG